MEFCILHARIGYRHKLNIFPNPIMIRWSRKRSGANAHDVHRILNAIKKKESDQLQKILSSSREDEAIQTENPIYSRSHAYILSCFPGVNHTVLEE